MVVDQNTAETEFPDGAPQLLHCCVRVLERERREGREPGRVGGGDRGERIVHEPGVVHGARRVGVGLDARDGQRQHRVWSTLAKLDVPLYLHPGMPPADRWHVLNGHPELDGALWSWQATTGGHAMRVVMSGVFDRHPTARMILGHGGEFLPFQLSRFDSRYATLTVPKPLLRKPSEYFGDNVLATTSGVLAPAAIEALVHVLGADAVLFAIDYPYEQTERAIAALDRTALSEGEKEKIAFGNARRLLRL